MPSVDQHPGPAAAQPVVSYRLLGPIGAVRHGPDGTGAIELGPPKQRAVLALLLLDRGRVVSTDRLIDALWGDAAPPSALGSLRAYVSNLRRLLRGPEGAGPAIVRRAGGYVMDVPAEHVDAAVFARSASEARGALDDARWDDALRLADDALASWRGEALEDFRREPWTRAEADRLGELRTECREARVTALLAARRTAPALLATQELRAAHPMRDRACWLHMIALHLAGRSTDALEEYRRHVARLDDELGVEPGVEIRRLETAILRHDPQLDAWPRPATWTGAAPVAAPRPARTAEPADASPSACSDGSDDGLGEATLVGRERELRVLLDGLDAALRGAGRWLVLTGTAGMGKTRMAEELGRAARTRGARELWARCSEEDGAPAWWPVRQLVQALGADPDETLVAPAGAGPDEARFAVYERVARLVRDAVARNGPIAVVVDDVQWADASSVRCLAHLIGALRDVSTVFALTLRTDEDLAGVSPLLAALARSDRYLELPVGPLSSSEVAVLASRITGRELSEHRATELAAHTGGNPLFVSEFARLPTDERDGGGVPLAVRSVLGRRLRRLEPEVLTVLRAAAVCGDAIDLPALVGITGTDPDTLADLLDEAAEDRILAPAPDTGAYAFAHGLLRREVLDGMPAMRRQRLHARAAEAMSDAPEGERASRRARHLVSALPLVDAGVVLDACREAAVLAEDRWSSETAAEWWSEALRAHDLLPGDARDPAERDRLLVARVFALTRAGRAQSVLDLLDASLLDAVRAGRTETAGRLAGALLRSAGGWPWPTYGTDPRTVLDRLEGLRPFVSANPVAHVRVLATLAVGYCYDDDATVRERLSAEALRLAEGLDDRSALADALLGRLITFSGVAAHADEAIALTDRLCSLGRPTDRGHCVDRAIGRSVGALALVARGEVSEASRAVREAVTESELLGLPIVRVQLRWLQGTLAHWHGDLDEAGRQYELAARVFARTELFHSVSDLVARLALARDAGGLGEIDPDGAPAQEVWEAAVAAERGDRARVSELVHWWLDTVATWTWVTLGHLVVAAHAVADVHAVESAPRLLDLLEPHAGRLVTIGHVGSFGPVDLATGRLHAVLGHDTEARVRLERAHDLAVREGGAPTVRRCTEALAALPPPS